MGNARRLIQIVGAWVAQLFAPGTAEARMIPPGEDAGRIHDGLTYEQPIIVTEWMRRGMSETHLSEYITEAARETFRFQFDTPQRSAADLPVMPTTEDPLREWDWATRERVLGTCHATYHRNPMAKGAVDLTIGFVIGDGFNLSCKNPEVERILHEFIDHPDNMIRTYEKECLRDLQVDGEIMIRVVVENGQVVAAPLRPWECHWIDTEPGFFRRKKTYQFQFYKERGDSPYGSETEMTPVPAGEIIHVAINKHGYELRGRPELYSVLPWLRVHKEWLENRARLNHWRNSFLWHVKVATQNAAALARKLQEWARPPSPGSAYVSTDKEEVKPLNNSIDAQNAAEDGRQIKMMTIVGLRMAEYMLGDGQNANLASAKAQQLPALTKFEDFQQILIEQLWHPLFKRVIEAAIDAELLPEEVDECDADGDPVKDDAGKVKRVEACKAFDVSYEPVGEDSPVSLAQAFHVMYLDGAISMRSYRAKTGFDPDMEEKQITRELEAERAKVAAGQMPPAPPGMFPTPNPSPQGGEGDLYDPEADAEEAEPEKATA